MTGPDHYRVHVPWLQPDPKTEGKSKLTQQLTKIDGTVVKSSKRSKSRQRSRSAERSKSPNPDHKEKRHYEQKDHNIIKYDQSAEKGLFKDGNKD